MRINWILSLLCLIIFSACDVKNEGSDQTTPIFEFLDPAQTGVTFRNDLTEDVFDESKNVLSFEYYFNGAGVAAGDFNNDGLVDLFFVANEGQNELYLNKGNLTFENITATANVNEGKTFSTGVALADVNSDGLLDIYVCQSGALNRPWEEKANLLYINNGDLTFTEKAKEYGLDDTNMGTQAAFFDYDKDGDLDCFILNESKYNLVVHEIVLEELKVKENLIRASSQLYRNDDGLFVNVSEEAGVLNWDFGLGLLISDINEDGWPDIYVANDYAVPDHLYINNGDGTFSDRIKDFTNQVSFYSMGVDIADINNDGLLDIGVVDMAADDHIRDKTLMAGMNTDLFWYYINERKFHYQYMFNALQINNGNNTFSNIANMSGVARTDWSWAALFADFDNDGLKDYFVTNGYRRYARDNDFRIAMEAAREQNGGEIPMDQRQKFYDMMPSIQLPNKLYRNEGDLKMHAVEKEWGTDQPSFSNGAVYVDLDNDGDLELVVNNVAMEAFVYKNHSVEKGGNNFLDIILKSEQPTENTKVRLFYNEHIQYQEKSPTRGYMSAMHNALHFGLGTTSVVDQIEITWPDGKLQYLENVPSNQRLVVNYAPNDGRRINKTRSSPLVSELNPSSLGITVAHRENYFNDFASQVLLPQKQSQMGPAMAVADVNGDGLDDFFYGGAKDYPATLFLQLPDGKFSYTIEDQVWALDSGAEDVAAAFYDADGDGDQDLYVVSGGSEFEEGSPLLKDRLYINLGKGKFSKVDGALPSVLAHGSCVKAADYDKDGDMDLFVGAKSRSGKYPFASTSQLLNYNNFKYTDVSTQLGIEEGNLGLVTDAEWGDFNGDGWTDLLVVCEWSSPRLFINKEGTFTESTEAYHMSDYKGWWSSVKSVDIDGDGDLDFVAGNLGLNSKFYASKKKPLKVYANDFDQNGTCDVVLSKNYNGKEVPTRGRQCSSEQMPFIKEKFKTYNEFAHASLVDILGDEGLNASLKLEVTDFSSMIFINEGKEFRAVPLPRAVQKSPINGIIPMDMNGDGRLDLIVSGNLYETEVETPRYDAGTGQILLQQEDGSFKVLRPDESGFFTNKNVKELCLVKRKDDVVILVANNDGPLQLYVVKAGTKQVQ